MRRIVFVLMLLFSHNLIFGQEEKEFDFIIVVDKEVIDFNWPYPVLKFILENDSTVLNYKTSYHPGNLSLPKAEFDKLEKQGIKNIFLNFKYEKTAYGKETKYYQYRIDITWVTKGEYNILKIYNMDEERNRKMFKTILKNSPDSKYLYEYVSAPQRITLPRDSIINRTN